MEAGISLHVESPARWIGERIDWLAIASLAALYAYGSYLIVFGEPMDWVSLIVDDAYYYLGIVRGLVVEGSSSFLPPFATNGYQPLWTWLLAASALVFGTSEKSLALQVYTACYAAIGVFAWMSKRRFGFAFPAIASAAVFSGATLEGMETAMLPALTLSYFYSRTWAGRGLASALLFLTRLDALALVVARDAYFILARRKIDLRHYLVLVPVAGAYFAFNYVAFGVAVPVSGLAKSIGSVAGENLSVISLHVDNLKTTGYLFLSVAMLSLAAQGKVRFAFRDEIVILLMALLAVCGYYTLRSGWAQWAWYYWPQTMLFFYVAMSAVLLLSKSEEDGGHRSARYLVAAATVLVAFAYALGPAVRYSRMVFHSTPLSGHRFGNFAEKNVELARMIRSGGYPRGTFFAMGDVAASFGFFLGREYRFIQTEGLVGPYAYYQSMKAGEGAAFLARHGVQFLIAERERFFEEGDLIGVVEPAQPLSSRFGQYLVCFRRGEVVLDQSYLSWSSVYTQRYVFDFSKRTACPASMVSEFRTLQQSYGRLKGFMLNSEHTHDTWLYEAVHKLARP